MTMAIARNLVNDIGRGRHEQKIVLSAHRTGDSRRVVEISSALGSSYICDPNSPVTQAVYTNCSTRDA
ncbi:hypothetical protein BN2476_630043 [Paraburkholderia piptadeniae]|uniref:Uncharacterized protein n=1 Tax=Paraburkholderia piptadeniae TaxID=1701573 RepID=A0A1N7SLK4_9BURK|nr:hypothetical protein BN2476_630043 [Paraburkholderia piptadeniae]